MNRLPRNAACLSLVLLLVVSGCNISRPYPEKNLFVIDPGQPPKTFRQVCPSTLRIYQVRVASPYDSQTFIYKHPDSRYVSDYYKGFFAPPEQLLTASLIDWISRSGLFAVVVNSGSRTNHQYVLEGTITEIYGDYSDVKSPKAQMIALFFLIDDRSADGRIIFHKTYHAAAPISGGKTDAMAIALNEVYRSILTELTEDLSLVKYDITPAESKPSD